MNNARKTAAAILAGGTGTRFAGSEPKQFALLGGRPVLCHSVEVCEQSEEIDGYVIVSHPSYQQRTQEMAARYCWKKLLAVLPGGETRADSSKVAIDYCESIGYDRLLIHDAARPLIDQALIHRLCRALDSALAVTAALPATDTLALARPDHTIDQIPSRDRLWAIQTPQGFSLPLIAKAYRLAENDPDFTATDDCGVVRTYCSEAPIQLVMGSRQALKLTYPEDLLTLESWLSNQ